MRMLAICAAVAVVAAAPAALAHSESGHGSKTWQHYKEGGLSEAYAGRRNPLNRTDATVAAGRDLYKRNCAQCHGPNATGDGEIAKNMQPKPADLRMMLDMEPAAEDYYFWMISEGGGGFDIPMPPFKQQLSDKQIWQLVTWMQAGFPGLGKPDKATR